MTTLNKYDVVIVGSGLGGLMSAVVLAKEGYKVCVLEKNNQFGGNLQTFSRDKKIFDTGVHYLGGLDPGQNLYRYFSYVGIMSELQLEKMPRVVDEVLLNQIRYPIAQGYDAFVEELLAFFPAEKAALERYIKDIKLACSNFPLYNLSSIEGYDTDILSLGLKEYLDKLTANERFKAVLIGNNFLYAAEGERTPFYVHALTVNSYLMSAYRCVNGASQISKLLVRRLRDLGGQAYKQQEVIKYHLEKGAVVAVETMQGKRVEGTVFISNVDPSKTLEQVGKTFFRTAYYDRIMHLPMTISSFSAHFVLMPKKIPYNPSNIFYHKDLDSVWSCSSYAVENWPQTMMISMTEDKGNPGYADTLTALTYMHFEEVKDWEYSHNTMSKPAGRPDSYETFKTQKLDVVRQRLMCIFPDLEVGIWRSYASTPLSYRDYIGSKNGNLYGVQKDVNNPLLTMMSPRTKIPNLFFTGQGVNMHGVLGVAIGAVATCSHIVGHPYLIQKIERETRDD